MLPSYGLFHCDLTPPTSDLYWSLKLSVLQSYSYIELFKELNNLYSDSDSHQKILTF